MQKKIIALALAAVAGSAAAQTNVTVYGIVDAGQAYVKSSSDKNGAAGQSSVGRLDSNSSYIGFKGVEDLGNGLKAVFQYETGFAADTGAFNTANRDTFVGLTGGFGTVVAGNLTHSLRAMGARVELVPAAAGVGTVASVTGRIAGASTGADDRAANAIAYVSPAFSGFSGSVAYVNGEAKTNNAAVNTAASLKATDGTTTYTTVEKNVNAKQYQVAGQYENGPLFVGAGYHKAIDFGNVENQDARVYRLAAVYTLPTNTKLTALYDNTKVTGSNGSYDKRGAYSLGVAQSFGKNTVGLEYAKSGDVKSDDGTTNNGAKIWTAVYTYELSKRTSVHARYSKLTNDADGKTNFYNNPVANPVALGSGSDVTGYMVGLRHAF